MDRLCVDALTRMPDLQHVAGGVALLYLGICVVYFEQMCCGRSSGTEQSHTLHGLHYLLLGRPFAMGRPAALSKGGGPQQQYTRPLYGSSVLWNS